LLYITDLRILIVCRFSLGCPTW